MALIEVNMGSCQFFWVVPSTCKLVALCNLGGQKLPLATRLDEPNHSVRMLQSKLGDSQH